MTNIPGTPFSTGQIGELPAAEESPGVDEIKAYATQRQPCDRNVHTRNEENNFRFRGDAAPAVFAAATAVLILCDVREQEGGTLDPAEVREALLGKLREDPM